MNLAVTTQQLNKVYYPQRKVDDTGGEKAVEIVTLSVSQDELFSLLGPNGAGKTTLV